MAHSRSQLQFATYVSHCWRAPVLEIEHWPRLVLEEPSIDGATDLSLTISEGIREIGKRMQENPFHSLR